MGKTYDHIDERLSEFIESQSIFFVATAPLAEDGLLNLSPKGLDTLRILDEQTVAYLDLTGSGVETIAHLKENGRCVMMFCAFEGRPMILRLHGRGEVFEKGDPEFERLLPLFPELPGTRSIIRLTVERIADSCGWAVPLMKHEGDRDQLLRYAEQKGDDGIRDAQLRANMTSLDGLPGLKGPST